MGLETATGPLVRVNAYVEQPIRTVLDRFTEEALAAALEGSPLQGEVGSVRLEVGQPAWISSGHVRIPVTWTARTGSGEPMRGVAAVSLLVVRSGGRAITEVVADVPREAGDPTPTVALSQVLRALTDRLEV